MTDRRAFVIVLLALALLTVQQSAAHALSHNTVVSAAGTSRGVSISDAEVVHGELRAVVTVSSTNDDVHIDAKSIRLSIAGGRPLVPRVTPVGQERRAVMLLIDTSGSMGRDGIHAATAAARTFLNRVPSDVAVGLATFADEPRLLVRPTTRRAVVREALPGLKAAGETALYDGLNVATAALGRGGSRTIVLLSDGGDTVSRHGLSAATAQLAAAGVRADAIAFRTRESDNAALTSIARSGHGQVVEAGSPSALQRAFGAAAQALTGQVRVSVPVPANASGRTPIRVTGSANGAAFGAVSAVTIHQVATARPSPPPSARGDALPSRPPSPPAASGGASISPPLWAWGAGAAVFLGLLGLVLALVSPLFTTASKRRMRSMDQYVGASVSARAKSAASDGTNRMASGALRMADVWAKRRASSAGVAQLLERADLPLRINEWYVLRAVFAVVSIALLWLLWHGSVLGTFAAIVVGLAVGLIAPVIFLKFKAGRRSKKFERQLPDVLTLIASSLSTGFSLAQAIDAITRDAQEPSGKEFSRALAETRIGSDIEDSLGRLAERMASTNLEWTVMAIRIQRQVGGNLAETLRTTAKTLRDREALTRQVQALSAEGRLSAYILIALPVGLLGYMLLVNRSYISLLWTSLMGLGMSTAGVIALVVGVFWMRKVVKVEV